MISRSITAADITQYLQDRDDFDLELFAHRSLRERGWVTALGGSYLDPLQPGKLRQFDVRGRQQFNARERVKILREVYLAVECKSLSPEFPLVVSRVPRSDMENSHDVIKRWHREVLNDTAFGVLSTGPETIQLYAASQMVGKSATQIRWHENGKKLIASDAEGYDKWSQAMASASELVDSAAKNPPDPSDPTFAFVMPVLLVNDGTLWVVDYADDGVRQEPTMVNDALLWVDREVKIAGRYETSSYHLSHLHIYTRKGFTTFLDQIGSPGSMLLERIFGSVVARELS